MKSFAPTFFAGMLFSLGLGISGMTRPTKVLGFLDLAGAWDPSLAFVMIGAIATYAVSFWFIRRRQAPIADTRFFLPAAAPIDRRLLLGATVFGVGWGLGGYCPGPAVASLAGGGHEVWLFFVAMLVGMAAFAAWERRREKAAAAQDSERPMRSKQED